MSRTGEAASDNDLFGHQIGDEVLKCATPTVISIQGSGTKCRYRRNGSPFSATMCSSFSDATLTLTETKRVCCTLTQAKRISNIPAYDHQDHVERVMEALERALQLD
jgi:hypothetical protein